MLTVGRMSGRRSQSGVVALNLVLVIGFALYAVIQLSRTALAVKQINNRVKTITTEVGPGSNVERLDMVAVLDSVADRADAILAAAKPLSGQANTILNEVRSINGTVLSINSTVLSINGVVNSINSKAGPLEAVVQDIRGTPGSIDSPGNGTTSINIRVDNVLRSVSGIEPDLAQTRNDTDQINAHTYSINCGILLGLLNGPPMASCPPP